MKLWDVATGEEISTLSRDNADALLSIAYSPAGKLLAAGDSQGPVWVWRVSDGMLVHSLHTRTVWTLAFSPDGKVLAGSPDRTVKLWGMTTGQEIATLIGHTGSVQEVTFSPDGRLLASGGQDGTVRLWGVREPSSQ